jgi:hypothetical protein
VSAARTVAALALSVFAASAGAETMKVAVNKANLREAATAEAAVVAVLDAGTEVDVLEKTAEWWKVQVVSTGTIGYLKPVFLGVGGEPPAGEGRRRSPAARRSSRAPRAPRDYKRFRLDAGGAFGASGIDFTEDRTIRQFAEDGRIRTDYATDPGPGFEGGLLFRVTRNLGVSFGASRVQHDGAASFQASIPHPLYFDRDREVSGSLDSVGQSETALHFDVVYTATRGKLDLHLFAGPTRMTVEADLLQDVQFAQTYPYDTLTVTGTPSQSVSGSAFGFNVGGGVDYRLGKSFGLGAQLRFSRAKAELVGAPGSTVSIDAGGLQVGLGARVIF